MKKHITAAKAPIAGILLLSTIHGAWPTALAQPRISPRPGNVAVLPGEDAQTILPGQNAQFKVQAVGVAPLAYQWRFNGVSVAGASSNILTLTNVAWTDFGRYDVVVSNSAGAVTSSPAWLMLATRWREFVVFSASDAMVVCGDPGWTGYLANRLGIPLRNYSVGGASSSDVRTQITGYLGGHTLSTNTLIGLSGGGGWGDMVLQRASAAQAASNHLANVRLLVEAGARSFLILRMPPPELVPLFLHSYPWVTDEMGREFEDRLDDGLAALQAEYPMRIFRPDLWAVFTAIWENPTAYGFHLPFVSPYPEVYCDGAHWTLAADALVSQECYRSLTPPLRITSAVPTTGGDLGFNWSGGSPPFQIQRTTDLQSGQWEAAGPFIFVSEATAKRQSPQEFFRVIFLGQ